VISPAEPCSSGTSRRWTSARRAPTDWAPTHSALDELDELDDPDDPDDPDALPIGAVLDGLTASGHGGSWTVQDGTTADLTFPGEPHHRRPLAGGDAGAG